MILNLNDDIIYCKNGYIEIRYDGVYTGVSIGALRCISRDNRNDMTTDVMQNSIPAITAWELSIEVWCSKQ